MINLYYKIFKLKTSFLYNIDKKCNNLLRDCIESEIHSIDKLSRCKIQVQFNNGIKYNFWNANKYYAWMNEGFFRDIDDKLIYSYSDKRPSAKNMYLFHMLLINFGNKRIKISDKHNISAVYKKIKAASKLT